MLRTKYDKKENQVREEQKRRKSEGKPYINNKNMLVKGKTGPQEEVSHILILIIFVQI